MESYTDSINVGQYKDVNSIHLLKSLSKGKILIIDEDSYYAGRLKELLECHNYEVILSKNGSGGIYNSIIHRPAIILCEVSLPDIDGFTVQRELNRYQSIIQSKFIYMSRYSNSFLMREAMDLGADKFLTKPIDCDNLLNIINQIMYKEIDASIEPSKLNWDLRPNNMDSVPAQSDNVNIQINEASSNGFNFINPNKIEINFTPLDNSVKDSSVQDPFFINRNELNDFEKFNFNELTLVIVNLSAGDQKIAVSFRDFLFPIISQNPKKILIDLSQITYIDSAFTGVLVEAAKRFKLYSNNEIKLVIDLENSTLNPFILEWIKRNFKTYDNINFAVRCLNESSGQGIALS